MQAEESRFQTIAGYAAAWSHRLSKLTEMVVIVLMAVLVLDVWLGIIVRYFSDLPLTFTEELARYLMIWMALLAVSIGISRRAHIGVLMLFDKTHGLSRHLLLGAIDLLGLLFFLFLFYYGVGFTIDGARRLSMIYGMPKSIPFAAVPVSCLLAAIQIVLTAVRDQAKLLRQTDHEEIVT
ncbi:MAG: TRAP transporter small permease [Gammaproteobacteria bacterium]|nr:TRAP transporter small permease [Gammaproteobacteria bacterium]